jgi:hypothetical protein
LLGENEKIQTFEEAAASAIPVAVRAPAVASASTTASRLQRFP